MAIQITATTSDVQAKVVNSYGTAITRTFSGLLPVGTIEQQASGDAIAFDPEAAPEEIPYNPLKKEEYQEALKGSYFGTGNIGNHVGNDLTENYSLLLNWTAGGVFVNRYYTNKGPKSEIEVI